MLCRKTRFLLMIVAAAFTFSSCTLIGDIAQGDQQRSETEVISSFYGNVKLKDYAKAYSLLTPEAKEKISQEDFVKKHDAILGEDGLNAVDFAVNNITAPVENGSAVTFDIDWQFKAYGTLSFSYALNVSGGKVDWNPSGIFPDMDWGDTVKTVKLTPARGEIFAGDEILVANGYYVTVYADPVRYRDKNVFASLAAPVLEMSVKDIMAKLDSKQAQRDGYAILKTIAPEDFPAGLREQLEAIEGVGIDTNSMTPLRTYPLANNSPNGEKISVNLAHTLGYIGNISENQLTNDIDGVYTADSKVGQMGLEMSYEDKLRGFYGREIAIFDQTGKKKSSLYKQAATHGLDLSLTINLDAQAEAEAALGELLTQGESGCVVVMDAKTGAVETLASYPTFAPSLFSKSLTQEKWEELTNAESGNPLFNRAVQGLYPPGSVIKPFTAAAAIESEKISTDFVFPYAIVNDRWTPQGMNWVYPPIKRVSDSGTPLNMERAMMHSDNIFFAYCALQMGSEIFEAHFKKAGFSEEMPFDMPVALSQLYNPKSSLLINLLADSGYGQGEMLITPLQMTAAFCALANGGDIPAPHIVKATYRTTDKDYKPEDVFSPHTWKSGVIAPDTLSELIPMLQKVTTGGSGERAAISGLALATKTGTAEIGNDKLREIGSIMGFPTVKDDPKVVLVLIDAKTGEAQAKFTIFKRVMGKLYDVDVV